MRTSTIQVLAVMLLAIAAVVFVSLGAQQSNVDDPRPRSRPRYQLWTQARLPSLSRPAPVSSPAPASAALSLIVLTMNRPTALRRLLDSLARAEYLGDVVDLDIWVDRPAEESQSWQAVKGLSEEFDWPHGRKSVHIRDSPGGLRRQWLETWDASGVSNSGTKALILEDDLEVSKHFWRWLKSVHAKYGDRANIAGFTLQRAQLCALKNECAGKQLQGGPVQDGESFGMPLVGSWGFSPTAKHWAKFTGWAKEYGNTPPYVAGIVPDDWYRQFEKSGRCPGPNCMW